MGRGASKKNPNDTGDHVRSPLFIKATLHVIMAEGFTVLNLRACQLFSFINSKIISVEYLHFALFNSI